MNSHMPYHLLGIRVNPKRGIRFYKSFRPFTASNGSKIIADFNKADLRMKCFI